MKKYITLLANNSKPLEVKAKPIQPKTEPAPPVHIAENYEPNPVVKKIVRNIMEKKNPEPPKQRNPVAKNANAAVGGGAAGKHKDKKKDAKQGVQKHKGQDFLETKKPKKTAQEKLSAAVDKERKKNEPATRRAKQELDAAMPSKSLAEGRVCPQCGSSKCSCPPGKCKCKPVAGFKPKMSEDKDPCWKNYKMVGTKKKGSKTVPNCVPKESRVGEAQNAAQQAAIAIAKKKKKNLKEAGFVDTTGWSGRAVQRLGHADDHGDHDSGPKVVAWWFYDVQPGQEEMASALSIKQTKSGKWAMKQYDKSGRSFTHRKGIADEKFGPGKQWIPKNEGMAETQLDELDRPSGKLYIIITTDNAGAPHVFGDFGSFPQDVMHKIAKRGTRDKSGAKTKLKIDFLFDDFRTTIQQLRTIFRDLDFIGAEAAEFIIKSSALRSDQGEEVKQLRDYIQAGDDRRMKMYQAPGDDEEEGEPTGGNILRIDPETGAARRVVGVKPQTQMGGKSTEQPTTFKYTLLKTELMPKLRDMGFKIDGNQIILRADQRDTLKNMLGARFQSVFGQKGTFKEGGEKYKIKSTGSDINPATDKRATYYISPSTGKKVYKDGVKKGDHENPNSGEHKPKVEGQIARAIMKEFGLK